MPYKSKAQAAYFNIHKGELEKQGVDVNEWNSASKGKMSKLPKHAKSSRNIMFAKAKPVKKTGMQKAAVKQSSPRFPSKGSKNVRGILG